ncbi:MAG TPA: thioredoxin family protein [Gaiellaceae bacterium]|jgi:thioredoxin-like negative regulator of GroEL
MNSNLETDAFSTGPEPDGAAVAQKPILLFFYSPTSGGSRRAEGFLAQVLQRRRNHDTFTLHRIDCEARHDLVTRCGIEHTPAIVVVEGRRVRAKLEQPRGCRDIQELLAPWLK